jgi:Flp pilus assembly pilin Flp
MKKIVHRFIADESGTGVVEADFVILVVAVVLMSAMANPGLGHAHAFSSAASAP